MLTVNIVSSLFIYIYRFFIYIKMECGLYSVTCCDLVCAVFVDCQNVIATSQIIINFAQVCL